MNNIDKFLLKISDFERNILLQLIEKILILNLKNIDIKKLNWNKNLFRIRKWKIRIIFKKQNNSWVILDINYRNKIYKKRK